MSLFVYSSVTVFVIVGGQPTTDDDVSLEAGLAIGMNIQRELPQLINTLSRLETQVADLVDKNNMLEAKNNMLQAKVERLELSTERLDNCKSVSLSNRLTLTAFRT